MGVGGHGHHVGEAGLIDDGNARVAVVVVLPSMGSITTGPSNMEPDVSGGSAKTNYFPFKEIPPNVRFHANWWEGNYPSGGKQTKTGGGVVVPIVVYWRNAQCLIMP